MRNNHLMHSFCVFVFSLREHILRGSLVLSMAFINRISSMEKSQSLKLKWFLRFCNVYPIFSLFFSMRINQGEFFHVLCSESFRIASCFQSYSINVGGVQFSKEGDHLCLFQTKRGRESVSVTRYMPGVLIFSFIIWHTCFTCVLFELCRIQDMTSHPVSY